METSRINALSGRTFTDELSGASLMLRRLLYRKDFRPRGTYCVFPFKVIRKEDGLKTSQVLLELPVTNEASIKVLAEGTWEV